jgi:hypothetical protein
VVWALLPELPVGDGLEEPVEAVTAFAQRHGFYQRGDSGLPVAGPHGSGRPVQETPGLAVNVQKASHLRIQLVISAASFVDVAVLPLRRQLADGVKE